MSENEITFTALNLEHRNNAGFLQATVRSFNAVPASGRQDFGGTPGIFACGRRHKKNGSLLGFYRFLLAPGISGCLPASATDRYYITMIVLEFEIITDTGDTTKHCNWHMLTS